LTEPIHTLNYSVLKYVTNAKLKVILNMVFKKINPNKLIGN